MTADIPDLHRRAQKALNLGDYKQAHQLLIRILQQDSYFADGYFLLGIIAGQFQNLDKAIKLTEQALKLSTNNAEYLAQLAKLYATAHEHVTAARYADEAANLKPSSALTLDTLGVAYSQIGLHHKAIPLFQQACKLKPTQPEYFFNLGASLKFSGDFEAARSAYEKTIDLAPDHYKAHAALSSLGGISAESNHIERLQGINQRLTHSDDKLYIGHALAREFEALGNYDAAFEALNAAKKAKLAELDYSFADDKRMFDALQQCFSSDAPLVNHGADNNEAIFVVGMPRTGTTLVERIISQHSDVTSAGELQHFGLLLKQMAQTSTPRVIDAETIWAASKLNFRQLGQEYINSTRALTGKTKRFVDKMPLNVLYCGFIANALPNAKILCLDRDPLDTIVSNFRQLFAVNYSYYNYAYDLKTTAQFYCEFKRLIDLWQQQYPTQFYRVDYQKLVNSPASEARKIIEFCQLDWQDGCLDIQNNNSPVATASAVQVRNPINNKSVGNWRRYQSYLGDVQNVLGND